MTIISFCAIQTDNKKKCESLAIKMDMCSKFYVLHNIHNRPP